MKNKRSSFITGVIIAQEKDIVKVHSALKIVSPKSLKTFSTRSYMKVKDTHYLLHELLFSDF